MTWIDGLIAEQKVFGIQAKGGEFAFDVLVRAADLRLDYDVSVLPPKGFFQPQREVLATFKVNEGYESVSDAAPFVLFGVHPYDVVAIAQMDQIFAEGQADVHYLKKRAAATIVACDVQEVSENSGGVAT